MRLLYGPASLNPETSWQFSHRQWGCQRDNIYNHMNAQWGKPLVLSVPPNDRKREQMHGQTNGSGPSISVQSVPSPLRWLTSEEEKCPTRHPAVNQVFVVEVARNGTRGHKHLQLHIKSSQLKLAEKNRGRNHFQLHLKSRWVVEVGREEQGS